MAPGSINQLGPTLGLIARNRRLLHLYISVMFAALFMSFQIPTFPLLAVHLGASYLLVGALAAIPPFTRLVMSMPAGAAVDRWGGQRMVLGGLCAYFLSFFLAAFPNETLLALSRVALGFGSVAVVTMGVVALADYTEAKERSTAMGFYMAASSVGLIVGSLLGLWLITVAGFKVAFLLGSGLAALAALHGAVTLRSRGTTRADGVQNREGSPSPIRLLRDPDLRLAVLTNVAFVAAIPGAASNFLPIYVQGLGIAPSALGIMLAWRAAVSGLGRIPIGAAMPMLPMRSVIIAATGLEGAVALALAWVHSPLGITLLLMADGLLWGTYLTVSQTLVTNQSRGNQRGVSMGVYQLGGSAGEVGGGIGLGAVAQTNGIGSVFRVAGIAVLLVTALALLITSTARTRALTPTTADL